MRYTGTREDENGFLIKHETSDDEMNRHRQCSRLMASQLQRFTTLSMVSFLSY